MIGAIRSHAWAKKITISRDTAFIGAIVVALAVTFFKLRPYFDETPKVVTYNAKADSQKRESLEREVKNFISRTLDGRSPISSVQVGVARSGFSANGSSKQRRVIERTLFDNTTVTVQAVLLRGLSSYQTDLNIEARVLQAVSQDGYDVDLSALNGATLSGVASMNMKLKRINFSFSSLVASDGAKYPVAGIAFDPTTSNLGAAANYASGIPSRMLGMAIGKAINLGDELAMSRILQNTTGDDFVTRELNRAISDANQQAAGNLSQTVTKDLNETEAELTLPAGTLVFIKLKARDSGGGQ